MSAISYTDWTVICDHEGCAEQLRSDAVNGAGGGGATATEIRRALRRRGWQTGVLCGPADDDSTGGRRQPRRDFCPEHKLSTEEN